MLVVISDTSPLFYLAALHRLHLLPQLYGRVIIPEEVWEEAVRGGRKKPDVAVILNEAVSQGWLSVQQVEPAFHPALAGLDRGECAAILLARQSVDSLLLIDEKAGRLAAEQLGIKVTGTLGILLRAKEQGMILAIRPDLETLLSQTGFRISEALVKAALQLAGEL
jgi:predicted nucleic acid-binding protein